MKKMPLIILIPAIAAALVLGGALVIKLLSPKAEVAVSQPGEFPNPITNSGEGSKPTTFLGGLLGGGQSTPTPTPSTAEDLSRELKNTVDDGGQSDFDALKEQSSGL